MRIEVLQLPPAEFSANSRAHWTKRYKTGKLYQAAVFYSCIDARNKAVLDGSCYLFIKALMNLTFIFPNQRRRDRDNCLARFKPGLDAIVQAGLILDDDAEHLKIGNVDILVDSARGPLTIIDLEEEMKNLGVVNNE